MKYPVQILVCGESPKDKPCRGATLGTWFGGEPVDGWFIDSPSISRLSKMMRGGGTLRAFGHCGFVLDMPRTQSMTPHPTLKEKR